MVEYTSIGKKKCKDSNNKNKKLDKFYSGDLAVDFLFSKLEVVLKSINKKISDFSYLEPCAGAGSFINWLHKAKIDNVLGYDIEPEGQGIIKTDFFKVELNYDEKRIAVGNPPFGYKGKLASDFINRCSEFCGIVIFILPIQFRRYNIQKKISTDLKLIYSSENLPKNSFVLEGKKYNVNCLVQIYVRTFDNRFYNFENLRLLKPLPNKDDDFTLYIHNNTVSTLKYFDKAKYEWDFAVPRQGFYDYNHKIINEHELKKNVQYLFVKYKNPIAKDIFSSLDFEKLSHTNTAILGYSNTDVVSEYNRIKKELFNK